MWGSGDSTFVDSARNLLAHALALDVGGWLRGPSGEINTFVTHKEFLAEGHVPGGARLVPPRASEPAAWHADAFEYSLLLTCSRYILFRSKLTRLSRK